MPSRTVFVVVLFMSSSAAVVACQSPVFRYEKHEIVESETPSGEVEFEVALTDTDNSRLDLKIAGSCHQALRTVTVSDPRIEVVVENFPDGSVRQYVVKTCGDVVGLIKIDREICQKGGECLPPRVILTDSSDRIIAEIANAENTEKSILLRDNMSQIISRAERLGGNKWEVNSETLNPLLTSMILCAARMEQKPCKETSALEAHISKIAILGTVIGIVAGGIYLKYRR